MELNFNQTEQQTFENIILTVCLNFFYTSVECPQILLTPFHLLMGILDVE